ncbi:MAG: hypothetical protein HC837_07815 [Chloroflexaceae bacterium]|nr:hypothetical protein [Chloroflexaceae bacterium]
MATLGNRVHTTEIDAMIGLMQEAGVQWQREEIFWDRVQKEPGGPMIWTGDGSGFYDYDRAIGAQVAAGINVLGLLDYNPYWFKGKNPHPDEWIEDWGNFVYAAVSRYGRERGWISHWELWNEPNLAASGYESGLYEIKDFVRILQVGRAAAQAADPNARIVLGGLATIQGEASGFTYDHLDYLNRVAQAGGWDAVDIIGLHPYHLGPPEGASQRPGRATTMTEELARMDDLLWQYGPKPIWITELGWASSQSFHGVDEMTQAWQLVRAYMLTLSHPAVEKCSGMTCAMTSIPVHPITRPCIIRMKWSCTSAYCGAPTH